jgi:hypothetical protein
MVQSEFLIHAWSPVKPLDKLPDLHIVVGSIDLNGIMYENGHSIKKITPDGLLFSIKDIASFLISKKGMITIDSFSQKLELTESILLGPVMTAFLIMRGFHVLNGVTLMKNDRAFLFTGISGVGKSSIAAALSIRGYTVLSDQICALEVSNDDALAMTAKPNLKLWKDCLEQLNIESTKLQKVREELNKYYYPIVHKEIAESYPLDAVFELQISPKWGKNIATIEQEVLQTFNVVSQNSVWKDLYQELGFQSNTFKKISMMSSTVVCKKISRPYALYNIVELADFIENQIST